MQGEAASGTVYFDPERQVWRYDFWRKGKRHFGYCGPSQHRRARERARG